MLIETKKLLLLVSNNSKDKFLILKSLMKKICFWSKSWKTPGKCWKRVFKRLIESTKNKEKESVKSIRKSLKERMRFSKRDGNSNKWRNNWTIWRRKRKSMVSKQHRQMQNTLEGWKKLNWRIIWFLSSKRKMLRLKPSLNDSNRYMKMSEVLRTSIPRISQKLRMKSLKSREDTRSLIIRFLS